MPQQYLNELKPVFGRIKSLEIETEGILNGDFKYDIYDN